MVATRKNSHMLNGGCLLVAIALITSVAAWFTHVVACLSDDRWGLLIAGTIMFPISIVHGVGLWFGFF